jgi:hypothetical protein
MHVQPALTNISLSLVKECQALCGITYSEFGFLLLACSSNMEPQDFLSFAFKCASLAMRAEEDLDQPTCWDGVFFLAARYAATLAQEAPFEMEYSDTYLKLGFESRIDLMTKFIAHLEGWTKNEPFHIPQEFQKHIIQKYGVDSKDAWVEKLRLSAEEVKFIQEVLMRLSIHDRVPIYTFHAKYNLYVQEHEEDKRILCQEGISTQVRACLTSFSRLYRASVHFKFDFSGWLQNRIAGFTASDYDAVIRGFFAFRERSQRAST